MRVLLNQSFRYLVSNGRPLLVPAGVLILGVVFQNLSALMPWVVERFYTGPLYTRVIGLLSYLTRGLSFSVGEVLMYLILFASCAGAVIFCVELVRRRGRRRAWVLATLRFATWGAAGSFWLFLFTFGLNYQRPLLFELLGFEQRKAEPRELEELAGTLVERVNQAYAEAHEGGREAPTNGEIIKLLNESYDTARELEILPRGAFAPPKPVYSSEVLTRMGISGVYSPLTAEPNYNADVPDFQLPFVIAHEMAHQRGVARESEANFVAYVVCINSRDAFVRYSGYRGGLGVLSELSKVEPERARELAKQLGTGYRDDSRRAALFWAKAAGAAGALSQRVNDFYLRANRVKAGVADYSNSTTLIIAYHLRHKQSDASEAPR